MKHKIQIFIILFYLLTPSIYSQKNMLATLGQTNMGTNPEINTAETPIKIRIIKSYHVVENVNAVFGGHKTTYTVSQLSMVNKYDLGPNNTRIVTPIYVEIYVTSQYLKKLETDSINSNLKKSGISVKSEKINKVAISPEIQSIKKNRLSIKNSDINIPSKKVVFNKSELVKNKSAASIENSKIGILNSSDSSIKNTIEESQILSSNKNSPTTSINLKRTNGTAYIDLVKTYERIAIKGYRTEDMLKKIANAFFYDGEFEKSAKWFEELFKLNTNLEPEYYYRYSKSLSAINENAKADQIMQLFKEKQKLNQSINEKP
jgi:hypothetical protein